MSRPVSRTASPTDLGRSCPYCRFPLKPGAEVVDCGSCAATHHDDCWEEGGGCAVVGCAGTAETAVVGSPTPVMAAPPTTGSLPSPSAPPPPPVPPAAPGGSGRGWLVGAIVLLAVAIAGGAAAFVLTREDDEPTGAPVAQTTTADPRADEGEAVPRSTSTSSGATGTADAPRSKPTGTADAPSSEPTGTADEAPADAPADTPEAEPADPRPPNGQQRTTTSDDEGLIGAQNQTWRTDTNTGAMEQTVRRYWQARADNDYARAYGFFTAGAASSLAGEFTGWEQDQRDQGLERVHIDRVNRLDAGATSGRLRVRLRTEDKDGCFRFNFVYAMERQSGKWRIGGQELRGGRQSASGC